MSMIINKADARKTVRDASADMAKSGGDVAPVARKTAHDASQPSGEAVRKVVEATSRDGIRKNAEAAEQNLQKAAEDLRGTMGRSSRNGRQCRRCDPSGERAGGRTTRPSVGATGKGVQRRDRPHPAEPGRHDADRHQAGGRLPVDHAGVGRLHAERRAVPYRRHEQHHARPVPAGLHGGAERSAECRSASHAEQQRQDLRGDGPCRQGCGPEHR